VKLYAQHGWGKAEKIQKGLDEESLQGLILSPHDEDPSDLRDYVQSLAKRRPRPDVLFDPQMYVSLIPDANEGKLPQYKRYYRPDLNLRDLTGLRSVERLVHSALDYQRELPLTHIVSPTILIEGFADRTAQVALSLAQESLEYWQGSGTHSRPLLISFFFSESALAHHDQVAEFLDTISLYEVDGFYIVVDRNSAMYSQDFEPGRLSEMLRIIYSLRQSRFEVVVGYSDLISSVFSAVGATACATGWSQKLRRFNRARFQPSGGGRQPRDRYTSTPLVNSIFLTELDACQDVRKLKAVLSATPYDCVFDGESFPSGVSWSPELSTLNHWAALAKILKTLRDGSVRARTGLMARMIVDAGTLYNELARLGVRFEAPNGPAHLANWLDGLEKFMREVRI
jgi:hypothetical protein